MTDIARIEEADLPIRSLMPEPGRAARVSDAIAAAPEGPLRGVLFGVKDIFRVDGLPTTAGSTLPPDEFAGPQSAAVSTLRDAGAVVLGKTVSTEFALAEPGPTRNPRNLAHTPGGSSSGSAAAVAAGHCPFALGSQTVGSTVRPAAFCGVVGYKPSFGRISITGVIPVSESFDTVGILAANVSWAERVAAVLCESWGSGMPADGTAGAPSRGSGDGVALLRSPVLGIPNGAYLEQAPNEGLRVLDGLGAKRIPMFDDIASLNAAHWRLLKFEMARNHASWFARYADRYRPRTAAAIREGLTVPEREAAEVRDSRATLRARIHAAMDDAGIDLWISPAAPGPAPVGLESTGDPSLQLPWSYAGLPVVTIPRGTAPNGLPLGLQLVARFMDDERLLSWASQLAAAV